MFLNRILENPWKILETTVCPVAHSCPLWWIPINVVVCRGKCIVQTGQCQSWLRTARAKTWPENKPNHSNSTASTGFGGLVLMPVLSTTAKRNHLEYWTSHLCRGYTDSPTPLLTAIHKERIKTRRKWNRRNVKWWAAFGSVKPIFPKARSFQLNLNEHRYFLFFLRPWTNWVTWLDFYFTGISVCVTPFL